MALLVELRIELRKRCDRNALHLVEITVDMVVAILLKTKNFRS